MAHSVQAFDSHCHLQDPAFDPDREEVYQRARAAGLNLVVAGYDLASSEAAVAFAAGHAGVWALVGVHPHEAAQTLAEHPDWEERLAALAGQPRVAGIGEIGLDYHYDHSPREVQRTVFRRQLALAARLGRPVAIHTREAEEDTAAILAEATPPASGVIHCFTGSAGFARLCLDRGFALSFAGVLTFKNAGALREVAAAVPADRLLIETDAPYLSPVPWRGRRNEPVRVLRVAEVLAAVRGQETETVLALTAANTRSVFRLGEA
ncbi:D-amino acyl-tRNA deacylase [Candidatus Hydrogenisulfobacillus filiaventi]|uniref:D-amino acyl-tRNA deacylase n=1 Tax=Candidatus Hydrogenisulfobacillus filiaventi TaxID=2707344 RepID=A0A6F8ZJG7_9FIRM|nr:TatD family hydrolase [Bacillota bacterium]CAB1130129.1 D-amino acyl-tRNA deacylase [Candidatus Hydrogenisulfobacillus filiaventi]